MYRSQAIQRCQVPCQLGGVVNLGKEEYGVLGELRGEVPDPVREGFLEAVMFRLNSEG